jgi:hypothetical protein
MDKLFSIKDFEKDLLLSLNNFFSPFGEGRVTALKEFDITPSIIRHGKQGYEFIKLPLTFN